MSNQLTQDKAAEGANLRRLLAGVNYSQFAREHKLDKSMIGQQMRGQRPISLHYATVYAEALEKTIGEISAYWGAKIAAARQPHTSEDLADIPMFLRRVEEPMAAYRANTTWPFSADLLPMVLALDESKRQQVEGAIRLVLAQLDEGEGRQRVA